VSAADPAAVLRRTPLWSRHVEAGARMVPFAGFDMPVVYSSILDEHRAVRTRAGVFDVSHMGELRLRGPDTLTLAQRLFTNDVAGTGPGGALRARVRGDGGVSRHTLYRTGERELCSA
jgi:aminomethyltransferase